MRKRMLVLLVLVNASLAMAEAPLSTTTKPTTPPLWDQRCSSSNASARELDMMFRDAGLDGWELAAVWPEYKYVPERNLYFPDGVNYCFKRPYVEPPPKPPAVPKAPPTQSDVVGAVVGSTRTLLTSCRDTLARNTTQIPVTVTIERNGRIEEASVNGDKGPFADCVVRVLRLINLPQFAGAPKTVVHVTLTLPAH